VPERVEVTLRGVPPGTKVFVGGELVATTPDAVLLPRWERPVELKLSAPGFESSSVSVFPDRALTVDVNLKRRAVTQRNPNAIPRDLESPF
jgi:hypothetical protein